MNKFDNIRWSESIICVGVKNIIFPIKFFHVAEISITITNNNHSERIVRATHDLIDSYGQVVYGPISNDQDNLKFLVVLSYFFRFANLIKGSKKAWKVSWTIQFYFGDSLFVVCCHILKTIYTRIEYVTIQCEAVRSLLGVGGNCTSEPVEINFFGRVVKL